MAREVVDLYHGEGAGSESRPSSTACTSEGETPDDMASEAIPLELVVDGRVYLPKLLAEFGLAESASRARGLLEQGGVRLDGEQVKEFSLPPDRLRGRVLQVGRRRFVRLG